VEVVAGLLGDCCGGGRRNGGSGGINPAKALLTLCRKPYPVPVGGMDETRMVDENMGRMILR
jgi:hypothetical protein